MFPYLKKLIKAGLMLSHGNTDVERSLSVNKQAIGTDRTILTPESLNGIRQVKDAVAPEDGKIHAMDFNKEFISCIRRAHERYRQRLEERKKQEEVEKNEKARKEFIELSSCEVRHLNQFETADIIRIGSTILHAWLSWE